MNVGRRRGWCVALLSALFAMSIAGRARAEAPAGASEAPAERRLVRLVIAADDPADAASLEASLRELLARLGLDFSASRAERLDLDDASTLAQSAGAELATAWVDLRSPRATAVLVEGRTGRVAVHRSVARDRSSAIVVEELAHIVQSSVEALAEAERNRPREPPPAPPPAPVPTPAPASPRAEGSRIGLDGGGFFAGRAFGAGAETVVGGGGLLGVALGRGPFRPALWMMGTYHVAFDVRGRLVDVHTKAFAMRFAPTLRLFGGERWLVEAGPQGGFDVLWTTPRATSSGLPAGRLNGDTTDVSPVLGALAAVHLAVGRSADLVLALAADVDLSPHRYVILEGAEVEPLFVPWRVRPALLIGFTFTLAGSPSYPAMETPQ